MGVALILGNFFCSTAYDFSRVMTPPDNYFRRFSTSRHISTHLDTSRHISTHLDTSRHISTHLATSRYISLHLDTSRYISLHLATSRHISLRVEWGRVRRCLIFHGTAQLGSGRVRSGRVRSGRVGSDQEVLNSRGSARVTLTPPGP